MKKLKNWFIGDYLAKTDDVFERAKIELLYSYSIAFFILGSIFYVHIIFLQPSASLLRDDLQSLFLHEHIIWITQSDF